MAEVLGRIPAGARTRFAPAPTGYLHLGHVANAIAVWEAARAVGGTVLMRIEDHDRQRCRPEYDEALLEDLEWLGFDADEGPVRQSDDEAPYADALARLRSNGLVYACDCSRATFAAWGAEHGAWTGPGCPGACRGRRLSEQSGRVLRMVLGDGAESWEDARLGARSGPVAATGDPPARDRHGNWAYGFAVVVDDLRHGIDLVVRGEDLLDTTPDQIRLGRLLGRGTPPVFLHHALILRPDGSKLSKATGDTGVRELRAAGASPADLRTRAGAQSGVPPLGTHRASTREP